MNDLRRVVTACLNETRAQVMCELMEDSRLPVQNVKAFYSRLDEQPALTFLFWEEDINQVEAFLCHAQTISLVSSYRFCRGAN